MNKLFVSILSRFKLKISFKMKLMLVFLITMLFIITISLSYIYAQRIAFGKLNQMTETTIVANEIITPTQAIPDILSNYFLDKGKNEKSQILKNISIIKQDDNSLKKMVQSQEGLSSLASLESLLVTYNEITAEIVKNIESPKPDEKFNYTAKHDELRNTRDYIKGNVQELINLELNYYRELKVKLDQQTNLIGMISLLVLIIIGGLCITIVAIYLNKIANTISKIAYTARETFRWGSASSTHTDKIPMMEISVSG